MESSTSKTDMMKPLFLKAGIPLALSVAGFIYAKIIAKTDSNSSSFDSDKVCSNEEILGLRNRIEELKKMELDLENHFLEYQEMKKQETMLTEVKNMLELEAARVEFLDREISSMEAENGRLQNLVVEYLRFLEKVKLETGMVMRRKVKKLLKNMKEKSRIIREQNMKIDAAEEEILRLCNDVEIRSSVIKKLEDRVEELQSVVNSLQEEKNEILMKLNAAENSASSTTKIDAEHVTKEEYSQVVKELEELREERATEIAEFIYLKWNNACLKHELLRNHEQEQLIEERRNHLELEMTNENGEISKDCKMEHQESGISTRNSHEHNSRRKKLLHKIKKWVEGNDHMKHRIEEKEKQEEDHIIQARRSYSSA